MNEKDKQLKILFWACLKCLDENGSLKVIMAVNYSIAQQVTRCYKSGATMQEVDKQIQNALNSYCEGGKERHD